MDILDRNATCPMCGKYYHRWDIHRNAIPDKKHQRTEAELCQCAKGQDARQFRRMRRLEIDAAVEARRKIREDTLALDEKNRQYWARVQGDAK